ncbi:MAG: aspartate carbamoyltransferase regulatory subunit [Candidatus Thermoplasmatota archaeon]|nr:aspartate carbamoyltransferase regulatory subunit [Euryarchaeota archaeon]MBU4032120.1 aspartate carbamoyltransferase regulatory subunit [Candidatus Thermoplasmatota archaeon]MBU4070646.1 aspartate carbamoyltransferase regulatory subunit [Candidatus Thermoplasmatota archaeon]MBU4145141.1 aspartate carbamoyltransferase regulatory subunit [Candidatus Thermoplasmatota archaeon]MBU4591591.1 aspartate carbamoyltransferase regulatory subunit [Candidatus Thermoplasmatota archaeon]
MKELKITPIKNGTVIDHIEPGMALKVARLLGVPDPDAHSTVSIAMYVKSGKMKYKDIIKIEDRELKKREVNIISLISPNASIAIIKDEEVIKKSRVTLPKVITGIARCSNPNCITNKDEPTETEFTVLGGREVKLRCMYCDRLVDDIIESII